MDRKQRWEAIKKVYGFQKKLNKHYLENKENGTLKLSGFMFMFSEPGIVFNPDPMFLGDLDDCDLKKLVDLLPDFKAAYEDWLNW